MSLSKVYITDNSDVENKKLEAARTLYNSENYQGALKLYFELLNTSISYRLYYEIGRCYFKLDDFENATNYFKKSIAIENYRNPSYQFLGNICYKNSEMNKAIEYWSNTFAYKPDDLSICLNLATSYYSMGMKFQSVFYYEKYLKYATAKDSSFAEVSRSLRKGKEIGKAFLQRGVSAYLNHINENAIELLTLANKNLPTSFEINNLLGKIYMQEKDYMHALIYLKQALCLNNKSIDLLENLINTFLNIGDYTSAYCALKRLLPLNIKRQSEYNKNLALIKELENSFDEYSYKGHEEWAKRYDRENNYHFALMEYENCILVNEKKSYEYKDRIEKLHSFLNPEEKIIRTSLDKGEKSFSNGDYKQSNRYFSRVIKFASDESSEYRLAKSRVKYV